MLNIRFGFYIAITTTPTQYFPELCEKKQVTVVSVDIWCLTEVYSF